MFLVYSVRVATTLSIIGYPSVRLYTSPGSLCGLLLHQRLIGGKCRSRSIGVALCYMLFHLRRLVTEYGGLRPNIACVRHCKISHHVLDLWQRIYSSLPSTLLNHFRAPPQPSSIACTDSTKIRVQRFPAVVLEAALLPPKGLATTQSFAKGDTIATFAKQDHRLRLLLFTIPKASLSPQLPQVSYPFYAIVEPRICVCKPWMICLQIPVLLLGEPQEWQGCLVQFDGSAHKHTQTGGAGVSLLHVTPSSTSLVQWLSIPLLSCSDNVVAEAHACRAAINLAFEYYVSCMSKGIPIDSVVVQGDILPVINYLQYKGRNQKTCGCRHFRTMPTLACPSTLSVPFGLSAKGVQPASRLLCRSS